MRDYLLRILKGIAITVAVLVLCILGWALYERKCESPEASVRRRVIWAALRVADAAFRESASFEDLERTFRDFDVNEIGPLVPYRSYPRKTANGIEIVLAPRSLCFCRSTFVIYDRGRNFRVEK